MQRCNMSIAAPRQPPAPARPVQFARSCAPPVFTYARLGNDGRPAAVECLRASYCVLGFAFGQGTYTAKGAGQFYSAVTQPAPAGAYKAWFEAAEVPASCWTCASWN